MIVSESLKKLVGKLYSGCRELQLPGQLPPPLRTGDWRFFSYGRHALCEALVLAGVGKGDAVLLPEYVCRDVLSAVNALGAHVEYYPVGVDLQPAAVLDQLPPARAVLAIDYFGFPQALAPFRAYCERTGARLIEDNAHGFLSRDEDGTYLGRRGDIGIFSFRKSIPLVNGSGLVVNHPEKVSPPGPQLPFVVHARSRMFGIKKFLRHLPAWNMTGLLYGLIGLDRWMRKQRTGSDYVRSGAEAELVLPDNPAPDSGLPGALKSLDVDCETARRRALYAAVEQLVVAHGGVPVFPRLADGVVPYGFPFRAPEGKIGPLRNTLKRHYMDCYVWPELPSAIESKAVAHYSSVWMVNFIW